MRFFKDLFPNVSARIKSPNFLPSFFTRLWVSYSLFLQLYFSRTILSVMYIFNTVAKFLKCCCKYQSHSKIISLYLQVDLTELPPPLFCRPRKSPKIMGLVDSRRQSSVLRTCAQPVVLRPLVRGAQSLDPLPSTAIPRSPVKRSCHSLQVR